MRLHRALAALAVLVTLGACEKNAIQDITAPAASSGIRFFNFSVGAPVVHFYDGTTKLTATSTATCQAAANPPKTATDSLCLTTGVEASTSTSGIAYGGSSATYTSILSGAWYYGIAPGQHTITAKLMSGTTKGTPIATVPVNVEATKSYSLFLSGLYNTTTGQSDAFVVEDNLPATDWTTAYVRFVNAVGNSAPLTLTAKHTESGQVTAIGAATAYKTATAFVKLAPGAYDLSFTYGATTYIRANVGLLAGHVYTFTARGDATVTSTTSATRPVLDVTANR